MIGLAPEPLAADPGRKRPQPVTDIGRNRLVQRCEIIHFVPEFAEDKGGVICELLSGIAVQPAELLLQRIGKIPVIQRHIGHDSVLFQFGKHVVIEGDAFFVDLSRPLRKQARPGQRHAERLHPEIAQNLAILAVTVVKIVRRIRQLIAVYFSRNPREHIPDAQPSAVLQRGALRLPGARRNAPNKPIGKYDLFTAHFAPSFFSS